MRLLLIHQNFPGQFRQLAPYLLQQGHELVAICSHPREISLPIRILRYEPRKDRRAKPFWCDRLGEGCAALKPGFADGLLEGWKPDCILAGGWGETIALPEILADVPR